MSPYLGYDSVEPFFQYEDKGVFILCRTSNKGARDFQDITDKNGEPLFEAVAKKAREWNRERNIGLVVGATYPEELKRIRELCPEMPLLIPGVGSQGGDLELAIQYGVDSAGRKAIINVSRQVIYAAKGSDFAVAAGAKAREMRDNINEFLSRIGKRS